MFFTKLTALAFLLLFSTQTTPIIASNFQIQRILRLPSLASNTVAFFLGYTFCYSFEKIAPINVVHSDLNFNLPVQKEYHFRKENEAQMPPIISKAEMLKRDTSIILLTNLIPMQ